VPAAGEGAVVVGDILGSLVGGLVPVVGFEGGGPLDDEGAVVSLEFVENLERVVAGAADVWTASGGGGNEGGFLVGRVRPVEACWMRSGIWSWLTSLSAGAENGWGEAVVIGEVLSN